MKRGGEASERCVEGACYPKHREEKVEVWSLAYQWLFRAWGPRIYMVQSPCKAGPWGAAVYRCGDGNRKVKYLASTHMVSDTDAGTEWGGVAAEL